MRKVQIFLRDFMWVPPNLEEDIIAAVSSAKDFVDWLPLITLYCVYLIVHWPYFEINLLHHPAIHSRLWRLKAAQSLISKKIQHFQPDTSRQHSTMKISGPNVSQGLDAFPQPIQANSYLIFVIFFTHTHFKSWKFYTRKVRKFTTKLPKAVFLWFFWNFFYTQPKHLHVRRSRRSRQKSGMLVDSRKVKIEWWILDEFTIIEGMIGWFQS